MYMQVYFDLDTKYNNKKYDLTMNLKQANHSIITYSIYIVNNKDILTISMLKEQGSIFFPISNLADNVTGNYKN